MLSIYDGQRVHVKTETGRSRCLVYIHSNDKHREKVHRYDCAVFYSLSGEIEEVLKCASVRKEWFPQGERNSCGQTKRTKHTIEDGRKILVRTFRLPRTDCVVEIQRTHEEQEAYQQEQFRREHPHVTSEATRKEDIKQALALARQFTACPTFAVPFDRIAKHVYEEWRPDMYITHVVSAALRAFKEQR